MNLLLKNGSDPNLLDCFGQTALHYAAEDGHENVTRWLVDVTDASIIDIHGRTALRCARDNNHFGTVTPSIYSWGISDFCMDDRGKTLMDWMHAVNYWDGTAQQVKS